jgi:hypothetical protein
MSHYDPMDDINDNADVEVTQQQTQQKKSRPARKQVKPGQVTKNEVQQTGKEYSAYKLSV